MQSPTACRPLGANESAVGQNPRQALHFIDRLKLYQAIFTDPAQNNPDLPLLDTWFVAYECLDELTRNRTPGSIFDLLVRTEDAAYVAWNLVALCPWIPIEAAPDPKRKPNALPLVAVIAREGFRSPNKLTDVIAASHKHREEIMKLKNDVNEAAPHIHERDRVGMAIRRWDAQGGSWKLQVLSALLVEAAEKLPNWQQPDVEPKEAKEKAATSSLQKQTEFLQGWQDFLDHLIELDVFDVPSMKRLLDGRALAAALGVKPGVWTGRALDICTAWQLRNPGKTDPAGAVEEVRQRAGELGISVP